MQNKQSFSATAKSRSYPELNQYEYETQQELYKKNSEPTLLNCRDDGKREAGWWGRKSVCENCLGRGIVEDKRNSGIRAQARSARPGILCANIVDSDLCHRFWKITSENNKRYQFNFNINVDHNFFSRL
jgi:hypothetical protein